MAYDLPPSISERIAQFTGRTWLLPPLLQWLARPHERVFLLTGDPGTGKSMITAWLGGSGPAPADDEARLLLEQLRKRVKSVHFCAAGAGSSDPRNMAANIARQLGDSVEGFTEALASTSNDLLKIDASMNVGTVAGGARVTNISIENFNLEHAGGAASFNRLIRDPLRALYAQRAQAIADGNEGAILIVDALDEAVTFPEKPDIVQLLAAVDDLPEQVRIVVTTRNDPRVLKFYRDSPGLDLVRDAPDAEEDVRQYITEQLKGSRLAAGQVTSVAEQIARAANAIFLYAFLVLRDWLPRLPADVDFADLPLPKGLSGLYYDFINREMGNPESRWFALYEPLLGLIAIGLGEGLSRSQLEDVLSQDVREALRVSGQYLHGLPDGPFQLFHKSLADFLIEDPDNTDYHIDPVNMHRRIGLAYHRRYDGNWQSLDEYGMLHLLRHVVASRSNHPWRTILDEYAIQYLFYHIEEVVRASSLKQQGALTEAIGRVVFTGLSGE